MEKLTVSVTEAGRLLGIGKATAYEAARTGQIPTVKIGRRLLVPVVALEKLLAVATQPRGENNQAQS